MGWEADLLLYIQENIRSDLLNPVMTAITHSGDYGILMIVFLIVLVILPRTRRFGVIAAISLSIESLINNLLLKNIVARTRPYDEIDGLINMVGRQKDFSFPSGHTGSAFAVMGAILLIAIFGLPIVTKTGELSNAKTSTAYKIASVVAIIYAVFLGFSRLYVGVHYPTDVIGGIILGLATSVIAYFIYRILIKKLSLWKEKG